MIRVALISDGIVQTVAAWDGVAPWDHPFGWQGIELVDDEWCEAGAVYDENATPRFSTLL